MRKTVELFKRAENRLSRKGIDITSSPASALPLRGSAVIGIMEHLMQMRDHGLALR